MFALTWLVVGAGAVLAALHLLSGGPYAPYAGAGAVPAALVAAFTARRYRRRVVRRLRETPTNTWAFLASSTSS